MRTSHVNYRFIRIGLVVFILVLCIPTVFGQCNTVKQNTTNGGYLISNGAEVVEAISGPNNNGDKGAGICNSYFRLVKVNNIDRKYYLLQITTLYIGMYKNSAFPRKITLHFTNGQKQQLEAYHMEEINTKGSYQFDFLIEDIDRISSYGISSVEYYDHKTGKRRTFSLKYSDYLKDQYNCIKRIDN